MCSEADGQSEGYVYIRNGISETVFHTVKYNDTVQLVTSIASQLQWSLYRDEYVRRDGQNNSPMWPIALTGLYTGGAKKIYTHFGTPCISGSNSSRRAEMISSKFYVGEFYVLLTVHLGAILVNNQLDAQFFFFRIYLYLFQFSTCFEHPCTHYQENHLY
jgi:hypothetical protein